MGRKTAKCRLKAYGRCRMKRKKNILKSEREKKLRMMLDDKLF